MPTACGGGSPSSDTGSEDGDAETHDAGDDARVADDVVEDEQPADDAGTNDGQVDLVDDVAGETDVGRSCDATTTLSLKQIQVSPATGVAAVDEEHDLLLAFPWYLGPSVAWQSGIVLRPGEEALLALPVLAEIPPMHVSALTYDPVAQGFLVLGDALASPAVDAPAGPLELLSAVVDDAGRVDVQRLPSRFAPTSEGTPFSWIAPEGDGVHYRALRGLEHAVRATVADGVVTWGPEVPLAAPGTLVPQQPTLDRTNGRLLVYGESLESGVPPDAVTRWFEPSVFALTLTTGRGWTRLPTSGTPPPRVEWDSSWRPGIGVWDDTGRRLVVAQDYMYDHPMLGETEVMGLWSLSASGTWTTITDVLPGPGGPYPDLWIEDRARRRMLRFGFGLSGFDLTPGHEMEPGPVLDLGLPSPWGRGVVWDGRRGRLVVPVSTLGTFAMPVRDGDYRWSRLTRSGAGVESTGPAVVYDGPGDRLVVSGRGHGLALMGEPDEVSVLDLDAPTPVWTTIPTGGEAPPFCYTPVALLDAATRTMLVVGGHYCSPAVETFESPLVAALDLTTMTWRRVAELPLARVVPLLHLDPSGRYLYVLFGERRENPARSEPITELRDGYRVDLATGDVAALELTGDLPTTSTRWLAGLELRSGFVVVSTEPAGVAVFRFDFSDGVRVDVTRESSCEHPHAMGGSPGVVDPLTNRGYIVGPAGVWEVRE